MAQSNPNPRADGTVAISMTDFCERIFILIASAIKLMEMRARLPIPQSLIDSGRFLGNRQNSHSVQPQYSDASFRTKEEIAAPIVTQTLFFGSLLIGAIADVTLYGFSSIMCQIALHLPKSKPDYSCQSD